MHAFRTYFCHSLYTLQRGLPTIAGLLVIPIMIPNKSITRTTHNRDIISGMFSPVFSFLLFPASFL